VAWGINAFAAIPAITDLDEVMMIAKMNARPLSGIIVVDVEDFGIEWCNAFGRLLADLAHWSGKSRDGTINGKKTPW
jgi:hypothetical protein